ncbi:carbohydrate sulfotransferase 4-like [Sceloporus undulatus]|uniref:carbohydrate sulfotransferase 4-like n=1 Tax=Sceloporus undulatus TaxID=8520 RepID=UPI001C4AA4B0|nr:carbohydrate sulfotransferase 4-like [Sceloporus undulatus]XP_042294365.1 carbohydrate sulfotransferase 4-like [Sceloporus undulatus]
MRMFQWLELLLILVIQALVLLCFFTEYQGSRNPQGEKTAGAHILIFSSWRSGSSFVGQLFSQHPNVFYLMEPAWHVWATMQQNSPKVLHMAVRDLIHSVLKCDMSVFDAYMPEQRNKSALFQWEASRALCSPPACSVFQRDDIVPKQACRALCSRYPFSTVEVACKTYSHVAVKEVRILDLRVVYPLLADPSLNLKIIHLVRDPRAVFRSRTHDGTAPALSLGSKIVARGRSPSKELEPEQEAYTVMREVCKSHVAVYTEAQRALPSALQGHYWLVRYEDIAWDPMGKAAELYRFVGLGFPPHLQQWVHNITHGQGLGRAAFDTTSRDAVNVSQAWRSALPYRQVAKLQAICQEAMNLLGYRLVSSEEEQQDLALSLLDVHGQPGWEASTSDSSS